ncbi:Cardiolipin synthetase [Salmonella enterica subsp. enterica]|uniref:Cardiolipin synthetase n=1 Tax=Salmonella enterica I TaxID=59201 RepID=A0A447PG52_SALET|nr:Cardiolipin synthetase [Salmonella enterica subsp. enterica]
MCSIIFGKTICPGGCSFRYCCSAAKRGVHVRLLLDDNNTPGLDDTLRLLDSHPNIEVRLLILSLFVRYARWDI